MNLHGVNVLVDGYNIQMVQGTGIKTYGSNLVKVLIELQANVNLLCSRCKSIDDKNPILNESLFFDTNKHAKDNDLDINTILSALIQRVHGANEVRVSEFVIKQDEEFIFDYLSRSGKIFNVYNGYKIANKIYKLFNLPTVINVPKKIDIWHATYPIPIKIKGARKITTIHDLIPLRLPQTTLDDKNLFFNLVKDAIKTSEIILAVSENTKNDILYCFDVNPDKIHVTYQPVSNNLHLIENEQIEIQLRKYNIKHSKYILFVGTIEPKKNIGRLIDAYLSLDTDMQLVITGKKGWLWENEIGKLESLLGKNVKLLEYVSRRDLVYLYNGAFCFVFPSLYEGFGLPPLEAMSLGCPVITSNVSCLPEVCGNAALYVDPYSSESIRQGIEKLINDPVLREELIKAGRERVNLFSMEKYAHKIYESYKGII
ncbi:glycosyl transferase family 1 [Cylindrospermopsis raciborskii C04]|uniref:Glycosyl transferase family 1 n=1 Tax=Cylindrospermopsis raciborskii C07 TaxID=2014886 RepID=A0ABX4WHB6_9CYAN|nr:glycosyltransferase family 1 protein [Cylindrospermopsis raciborskii]PNJ90505.1 glycosyl transferase family 1 [Cylindrospermopsis raciborskii C04]PNJ91920.1 glycosyl transferase family 1 [Cylindrospermopsis raciborskii C07]PNJ92328.1 glycosyl transferase family 1 [Cylindrospermopsis raciborskii C03]